MDNDEVEIGRRGLEMRWCVSGKDPENVDLVANEIPVQNIPVNQVVRIPSVPR